MALTAGWLDSTLSLIQQAKSQARQSPSSRKIATVEPWHDEPGWYLVQGRLSAGALEFISEGNLAYGSGDHAVTFDVLEVIIDGEEVRVRASGTAPRDRLQLCVRNTGLRQVLEGLGNGLTGARENPLLTQFGERRLTSIQADPRLSEAHGWPSLRLAQREAVAACCSPGLQLVWGPPGTGKTFVIATAISHLVASGQRVLLVSNNNIAVDTAFHEAVRILRPGGQGQAVRVGNIGLPALAADRRVRLDLLVEARQAEQQACVDELARQLEGLARAGNDLVEAENRLADFDPDAYQRAAERVLSLACCEAADREAEIRQDIAAVDAALAAHQGSSLMTRSRHPGLKGRLAASRTSLANELAQAATARRQAIAAATQAGADPTPSIRPDAAPTAAAAGHAHRGFAAATAELGKLQEEAGRLTRAGLAGPADETRVTTEHRRWELYGDLPDLRKGAQEAQLRRVPVRREYDEASERLHRQKRAIEREIISGARLVGTTLTQLTLRPGLTQVRFDHVIVDEAAAAQLPHLAHAVGYAQTGAVLVGDYLQNGPIVERSFPGGNDVQDLFKTNCFSFFDATEPRRAKQANLVAYDGVLTTARNVESDIVVVTVDGLPEDIRAIHREGRPQAGWWLIGALLARALAEFHNDAGARDAFGVVVPYKAQEEATQAALDDSALAMATPVGTSHKFQGQQFDTVLADLVEDGCGWMATANLRGGDYSADGVRLFNVAATRPRSRLYVLVGRGALEQARNGPLAALQSMVSAGRASRVDANSLLGMFDAEPPPPDTPEADLVAALDPYVRVAGMHDEDTAIDEVITRIDQARDSVWCWSAWVGRHADGIIDSLYRAHQRGVSVHVMARPKGEVPEANRESLSRLVAWMPRVIFMQRMHQKIVVVDRQWSIVGSMNMLSHGPTSAKRIRDIMFTMDGARFADRLLRQELADELAQLRSCPTCSQTFTQCGFVGSGTDRGWSWICTADRTHRRKFPSAGTRYDQRRNDQHRT